MLKRFALYLAIALLTVSVGALTSEEQKWHDLLESQYGARAAKRLIAWREIVNQATHFTEQEKLQSINQFFNQFYFVDDIKHWGLNDYWATPLEFIGANAGDCEDFTIAKYFSLLEMGVNDTKLRLIYVKAIELNQFHMVLAYYETPGSEPLILDNIDPQIKRASKRDDLLPIYSFNGQHLWIMKESVNGKLAGNSSRLGLWNNLRERKDTLRLNQPSINYDE
jgi:predicted transglutaminase-like cysteine proteinase